jgi:hypothetical protein
MKDPDFNRKLLRLICAGYAALAVTVLAESPEAGSSKKAISRTRPQVIYHLPPASNYAATLHSQAKGQNNDLPIDDSMPISLQMSRANANAAAAQHQQTATPPPAQEPRVKTSGRSNRPPARPRSFVKPQSHGNGHGNKSHKK